MTGVDAAAENIAAASAHAAAMGLPIDYRHGELGSLGLSGFDLVCSLEVIEHVTDKALFIGQLADALADDGLMFLSCPNRTPASRLLLVEAAERLAKSRAARTTGRNSPRPTNCAILRMAPGWCSASREASPGRRRRGCTCRTICR